jgi:hypothetical protein
MASAPDQGTDWIGFLILEIFPTGREITFLTGPKSSFTDASVGSAQADPAGGAHGYDTAQTLEAGRVN